MTEAFTTEETVSVAGEKAWAALTDLANAPVWMPGIDSMTLSGDLVPGAIVTFHTRGKENTSTITELDPGRSMTLRSVQGGVTADYVYRVETLTDATSRVILTADVMTAGAMKLLGPVIRSAISKADGTQLARFKEFVERGAREQGIDRPRPHAL